MRKSFGTLPIDFTLLPRSGVQAEAGVPTFVNTQKMYHLRPARPPGTARLWLRLTFPLKETSESAVATSNPGLMDEARINRFYPEPRLNYSLSDQTPMLSDKLGHFPIPDRGLTLPKLEPSPNSKSGSSTFLSPELIKKVYQEMKGNKSD